MASGKLTRREVEEVLRRAAELEAARLEKTHEAGGEGGEAALAEADLYRLGDEAGLSPEALREALVALRAGEIGAAPADAEGSQIFVRRTVPGEPAPVARAVERFLRDQLMIVRRHHGERIEWQRARGLWPGLMSSVAFARRFAFGPVARVETRVAPTGSGTGAAAATEVSFRIDLGPWRRDRLWRALARAAAAFGCFGLGGAWLMPGFGLPDVMALLTGGGIAGGLMALERRRYQHSVEEVAVAPERFLDLLVQKRTKALAARHPPAPDPGDE